MPKSAYASICYRSNQKITKNRKIMSKFSPSEVDALLNGKPTSPATSDDLPADFFATMEARILAKTAAEPAPTIALKPRSRNSRWMYAAAAVLLFVVAFAVQHGHRIATTIDTTDDIYAVTEDMTDDDIEDLDELYEADVFLEEL